MKRVLIPFAMLMVMGVVLVSFKTGEEDQLHNLHFADPKLKTVFEQFDTIARGVAQPDWRHVPYRPTLEWETLEVYRAEWNSHAPLKNAEGEFVYPNHTILVTLSTGPSSPDLKRIRRASIQGFLYLEKGWGVRCDFGSEGPKETDTLSLTIFECIEGRAYSDSWRAGPILLSLPNNRVSGSFVHNDLRYSYISSTPHASLDTETIQELWRTPESFRRIGLEQLDQLEEKAREDFAAGTLIAARPLPLGWKSSHGAPILPPGWDKPLPEAKKRQALEDALKKIDRKRETVRKDYRELHKAVQQALPLGECLEGINR